MKIMPRQARIDAPGALHHIICRGIEQRNIFRDNEDREFFLARLGDVLSETSTPCYAWSLMPNHFHLLLRTGNVALATVMRRVLTGYAVSFNLRHHRHGHLFQNRYKSILCQEDPYFLELVRYIHLNPLRARIVANLKTLDSYPYSGHSVLMGRRKNDWQDTDMVLVYFGRKASTARKQYRAFVGKGIELGKRPDLIGGGLIRSAGGWYAIKALRKSGMHFKNDERILGDSDFVQSVLEQHNEQLEARYRFHGLGYDFDKVVERVAKLFKMKRDEILRPGKQPKRVRARSLVCYWAVKVLGMNGTEAAKLLGMAQSSVSRAVQRGEKLAVNRRWKLDD